LLSAPLMGSHRCQHAPTCSTRSSSTGYVRALADGDRETADAVMVGFGFSVA
jgi:hypothetical protein